MQVIKTHVAEIVGTICGYLMYLLGNLVKLQTLSVVIADVVLHDAHTVLLSFLAGGAGGLGGLIIKLIWQKFKKRSSHETGAKL